MKCTLWKRWIASGIVTSLAVLLTLGCTNDNKTKIFPPPALDVRLKLLNNHVPEGDVNDVIPFGVWVYDDKGDSLAGYSYRFWVVPDSIGDIAPHETWIPADISRASGVKYDMTFTGTKYGRCIIHCEAKDAYNVIGSDTLGFVVKVNQGR